MPQVADMLLKVLLLDREPTNEPVVDASNAIFKYTQPDIRPLVALWPEPHDASAREDITSKWYKSPSVDIRADQECHPNVVIYANSREERG